MDDLEAIEERVQQAWECYCTVKTWNADETEVLEYEPCEMHALFDTLLAELKRLRRALQEIAYTPLTITPEMRRPATEYLRDAARNALQENDDITIAELPEFLSRENE